MDALLLSLIERCVDWFTLPRNGLSSVFLVALVSATLLPMGSEPVVFGYVKLNPGQFWAAVAVATLGNTLGGMVSWWMGRGAQALVRGERELRILRWFERLGPRLLFFSWLPVLGDPLCAIGGWLRLAFWPCVVWMALGKLLRYTLMTAALLWIPDGFWSALLRPFGG
jgi:membrane protein YqaA with SNARE-associated domain